MGIAKIDLRISIATTMIADLDGQDKPAGWSPMELIQILSALPKNSVVVGFKDYGLKELAFAYEILVYNKIFKQGSTIIVNANRNISLVKGESVQFDEFKGLDLNAVLMQEAFPATVRTEVANEQ